VNPKVVAAYAAMCSIWGTTWLAIKFALQGLPPITGAGVRFVVAGLFLFACGRFAGPRRGARPPLGLIVTLAITLFGLNYACTYYAETGLASGLVAVLFGTLPFFVFTLGAVMLRERVSVQAVSGAVLALGGVAAISLAGGTSGALPYILATLFAAFSSAYANVVLKRHAASDPFATLAPAMLLAGVVMTTSGALWFEHPNWQAAAAPRSLAAIAYLAIFGSGIAFFLNHWLLQRLETWVVGLSSLIVPVLAVIVGAFFGGESFSLRDLAGVALVIAGVWLAVAQRRPPATLGVTAD
jgi:drug/metabolite transporter (DMT)-like permease